MCTEQSVASGRTDWTRHEGFGMLKLGVDGAQEFWVARVAGTAAYARGPEYCGAHDALGVTASLAGRAPSPYSGPNVGGYLAVSMGINYWSQR